jgi:demethylmenaquinone methyltransferase/2-methoxy-6-polyprenyl-1,4-benzoquinol methylase
MPALQRGYVPAAPEKRRYVREMFSAIAPRYDLLNRLLSLNLDRSWRRRALARLAWQRRPAGRYLDACAGTMDLAAMLAAARGFEGRVVAADFAPAMLLEGRRKAARGRVLPAAADALRLPFGDGAFDGVVVGFGVRNFADLDAGLAELARVLASGGRLVVLEFSRPPSALVRTVVGLYNHRILPVVGRVVSGHPTAYSYLPSSMDSFAGAEQLLERFVAAGMRDGGFERLMGGMVAIHWGTR